MILVYICTWWQIFVLFSKYKNNFTNNGIEWALVCGLATTNFCPQDMKIMLSWGRCTAWYYSLVLCYLYTRMVGKGKGDG